MRKDNLASLLNLAQALTWVVPHWLESYPPTLEIPKTKDSYWLFRS